MFVIICHYFHAINKFFLLFASDFCTDWKRKKYTYQRANW